MSKIRSLPRFCIGLSAAALLTLGLAAQAQEAPPRVIIPAYDGTNQEEVLEAIQEWQAQKDREYNEYLENLWNKPRERSYPGENRVIYNPFAGGN